MFTFIRNNYWCYINNNNNPYRYIVKQTARIPIIRYTPGDTKAYELFFIFNPIKLVNCCLAIFQLCYKYLKL